MFAELPYDVYYDIGLNLDYSSIIRNCSTSINFWKLGNDPLFWIYKSLRDFPFTTKAQLHQISREFTKPKIRLPQRETYLYLAGQNCCPLWGGEKYGNINDLTIQAINSGKTALSLHYFSLCQDTLVFCCLGNSWDIATIDRFIDRYPHLKTEILNKTLQCAASHGRCDLVRQLIDRGAYLYKPSVSSAIRRGDPQTIQLLINQPGLDINEIIESLAGVGNYPLLEQWLSKDGIKLSVYKKILFFAAKHGNRKMIDLTITPSTLNTGLWGACEGGNLQLVEEFLNLGANDIDQALEYAAVSGNEEIIDLLLKLGVRKVDRAIISAIRNDHDEVTKKLIDWGGNLVPELNSLLVTASFYDNLPIIKYLVDKGACNIDEALSHSTDKKIIQYFLGKWVNNIDRVLRKAAKSNARLFEELFSYAQPNNYNSYLVEAARHGHLNTVRLLLSAGATEIDAAINAGKLHYHITYYITTLYK